jgi:hypothetical protein
MAYLMKSDSGELVIRDDWYASDFQDRALERLDRLLTPDELHRAMKFIVDTHDANIGISWEIIDIAFFTLGHENWKMQRDAEGNTSVTFYKRVYVEGSSTWVNTTPHATNNTVHMREDLAEAGFMIPAGLSHSNYDELHDVTHLTEDDLIGAVQYDTGEDPDSHAFCPVMLRDGRIVYMMGVDLDF